MKLEPDWLVGFVDGDGFFRVGVQPNKTRCYGIAIKVEFIVTQHHRDLKILHALRDHFGCGRFLRKVNTCWDYRVQRHEDFLNRVIPFFEKHPLKIRKKVDFRKWSRIVRMMSKKEHLHPESIARIQAIASTMTRKGKKLRAAQVESRRTSGCGTTTTDSG